MRKVHIGIGLTLVVMTTGFAENLRAENLHAEDLHAVETPGSIANDTLPAFPGAEGWGAQTVGGRGGRVYIVTTLDWDVNTPGSLAHALNAQEPRTIVFEVSGVIDVPPGGFYLGPEHAYLTIAGQTSPGGITLRNVDAPALFSYQDQAGSDEEIFHDLIVRHVRIRAQVNEDRFGAVDGISMAPTYNLIFDHVDFSGGWDETVDIGYSRNVTLQWSTWSNSGAQGYGFLLAYQPTTRITLHHNLAVHHQNRCLAAVHWGSEIEPWGPGGVPEGGADLDIRNNVVHNCSFPSTLGLYTDPTTEPIRLNYVGNTVSQGDDRPGDRPTGMIWFSGEGTAAVRLYESDNSFPGFPVVNLANESNHTEVTTPWDGGPIPVTTHAAGEARERVLNLAGAWPRDAMTARIVEEARAGTGAIGTYDDPLIQTGPPAPADTDRDGMPDNWETSNGMTVGTDDSAGDSDGDGWTNLEEYLDVRALQVLGEVGTSASTPEPLPGTFTLEQNYPNPFNPATSIRYSLPEAGPVRLTVYNLLGQAVRTLVEGPQRAGAHTVTWNGLDEAGQPIASGVYIYTLTTGGTSTSRKMIMLQ